MTPRAPRPLSSGAGRAWPYRRFPFAGRTPWAAYMLARQRMAAPLDALKVWLTANNAAVMSVLMLVIGFVLVGKGLGGLL